MATTVFTITGITPPARFDDLAWTIANLQQSDTETGSFTLLEAFTLDPVDVNPQDPESRSFTTELATVEKWYRVVFEDEDGDLSEPSPPVQNISGVEAYATAAELGTRINVSATTNADALNRVLLASAGVIDVYIARSDLAAWEVALATQVNLAHAAELWEQMTLKFGVIPGEIPTHTANDSFQRHRDALMPIKAGHSFGFA